MNQGLIFLPIHLENKIDKDEILKAFNPTAKFVVWKMEKLTTTENGTYGKNSYTEEAKTKYPNLLKFLEQLPFTHISNVKINLQTEVPPMHVDFTKPENGKELSENILGNEPSGYRIVIKGQKDSLIVHDGKQEVTALMPDDADCYVLDQSKGYHTVKHDPDRVIIYVTGFIDPVKHKKILEDSLERYRDFGIWKSDL
jgi:hypothetical protein